MNSITHTFIATQLESTVASFCTVQVRGLSPGESPNLRLSPPKCHISYIRTIPYALKIESQQWEATALCPSENYHDCVAMAILTEYIVILATLLIAEHHTDGQYKVIF